jgi:hypothetical protein
MGVSPGAPDNRDVKTPTRALGLAVALIVATGCSTASVAPTPVDSPRTSPTASASPSPDPAVAALEAEVAALKSQVAELAATPTPTPSPTATPTPTPSPTPKATKKAAPKATPKPTPKPTPTPTKKKKYRTVWTHWADYGFSGTGISALCPKGYKVVKGGYTGDAGGADNIEYLGDLLPEQQGWTISLWNNDNPNVDDPVSVWAKCYKWVTAS